MLHNTLEAKIKQFFPEKKSKHTTDDSPWCNDKVKKIKKKILKCREYNKHRMSPKWLGLENKYKHALVQAKSKYYKNIVKDLKQSNPSQCYSKLKRICSYDQERYDQLNCEEIDTLTDEEQAEKNS